MIQISASLLNHLTDCLIFILESLYLSYRIASILGACYSVGFRTIYLLCYLFNSAILEPSVSSEDP
jgi:hypothetical protein